MTPPLSRNADFVKLWTGFTIARVGGQITVLALPRTAVLLLSARERTLATCPQLFAFTSVERVITARTRRKVVRNA